VAHKSSFAEINEQAARIILAQPERYAGGLLEWANLWIERYSGKPEESGSKPKESYMQTTQESNAVSTAASGSCGVVRGCKNSSLAEVAANDRASAMERLSIPRKGLGRRAVRIFACGEHMKDRRLAGIRWQFLLPVDRWRDRENIPNLKEL
jgi:hypothetical protein